MLKRPLTVSSGGNTRFKNPNYKRDYTKIAMTKIDIEYDNTIASDDEQYQKAADLGYMNP
jgi:hypothetical protein